MKFKCNECDSPCFLDCDEADLNPEFCPFDSVLPGVWEKVDDAASDQDNETDAGK